MRSFAVPCVVIALASPAFAHPGGHDGGDSYRTTPRPVEPTVIPDTLPGVAAAIRERVTAVSTALDAGKIADLHGGCVNVAELAYAIPTRSSALSAEAKAKAEAASARLQQKASELYTAAVNGDLVAGKAAIVAISTDVKLIEGLAK